MRQWRLDRETLLEIGMVALAAFLLGGLAFLLYGRVVGGAKRSARNAEPPPAPGSVPRERHQNISAVATTA